MIDLADLVPDPGVREQLSSRLSQEHLHMLLAESAILPQQVLARGYYTERSKSAVVRKGFSQLENVLAEDVVPALMIPSYSFDGQGAPVSAQVRPSVGRLTKDGKRLKYESLPRSKGRQTRLDIPPGLEAQVLNHKVPLVITEGVKKADSAACHGMVCVALPGVWNFIGRNETGSKVFLNDLRQIPFDEGRLVYIVFDSDVMTKDGVKHALRELGTYLSHRGARVIPIVIPSIDGGKVGLDDWFAAGHTATELLAPINYNLALLERPKHDRYMAKDGSTWMTETRLVQGEEVVISKPLANFTAEISSETDHDDGTDLRKYFQITAVVRGRSLDVQVPASDFASMNWVLPNLGPEAIVAAGTGVKDHFRAAVQTISGDIPTRSVYAHTGWREVGGERVYLTAGGAIGKDGLVEGVDVELDRNMERYRLETPAATPVECFRASLSLLELAPLRVTAALLGSVYLAPLIAMFDGDTPNFVTWLYGGSGVFKSELAGLAQSHWGEFPADCLPGSFFSTPNAIERQLFVAKDALLVIDDNFPTDNAKEAQAIQSVADRLLRSIGNRKARDRMQADTRGRAGYPPRCMAMATSEKLMSLQSTSARMFAVEIKRGDVDVAKLTIAQGQRELLRGAMAHYLRWLAAHYDDAAAEAVSHFRCLRTRLYDAQMEHGRQPSQVAHLIAGLALFAECAKQHGALTDAKADELGQGAAAALVDNAREHGATLEAQRPVNRFFGLLWEAFVTGQVHVTTKTGGPPEDARRWGWRERRNAQGLPEPEPINPMGGVGQVSDEYLDLLPNEIYAVVCRMAREQGQIFPVDQASLVKLLDDEGYVEAQVQAGKRRRLYATKIHGQHTRVLRLRLNKFEGEKP